MLAEWETGATSATKRAKQRDPPLPLLLLVVVGLEEVEEESLLLFLQEIIHLMPTQSRQKPLEVEEEASEGAPEEGSEEELIIQEVVSTGIIHRDTLQK